jgi:hypothetical protein
MGTPHPFANAGATDPQPEELLEEQSVGDRVQEPARVYALGQLGKNGDSG